LLKNRAQIPPVYITTLLFIGGILSGFYRFLPAIPLALFLSVFQSRKWFWAYFLFFIWGFFYVGLRKPDFSGYLKEKKVLIYGTVEKVLSEKSFLLKKGNIKFRVFWKGKLSRGEKVEVRGTFTPPSARKNFSSVDWLKINQKRRIAGRIFAKSVKTKEKANVFWQMVSSIKNKINKKFAQMLEPKTEEYVKSIIWGEKKNLSEQILENFKKTGLMHLLAVSGLHVGLFTGIVAVFLSFFMRRTTAIFASIPFAFFYSILCGMSPSSLRAAIMFSVVAVSFFLGRKKSIGGGLFFSAFLMLLWEPYLIFSLSFLLSYFATFSIVFFSKIPYKFLKKFLPDYIAGIMAISFSCQIFIIPLLNENFLEFSSLPLITNLFALPLAGGIVFSVFLNFLFLLPGISFLKAIAIIFSYSLDFFVYLLDLVVNFAGKNAFVLSPGHLPLYVYIGWYVFLISLITKKLKYIFAGGIFFVFAVFIFLYEKSIPEVHFSKFSKANCAVLKVDGKIFQVNVPSNASGKLPDEYLRFLKFYGIRKIDACFLISPKFYDICAFDKFYKLGICRDFFMRKNMEYTNDVDRARFIAKDMKFLEDFKYKNFSLEKDKKCFTLKSKNFEFQAFYDGKYKIFYEKGKKQMEFCIIPEKEEKEVIIKGGRKVLWL